MKSYYLPVYFIFPRLISYQVTWFSYLYGLIILTSVGWTGHIHAKEIYLLPSMSIKTEYDNNKRLRNNDNSSLGKSSYGVIARANAELGVRADRYSVVLNNQFILNRFFSDFDLDSDDFNFNLNSDFKVTEKHSFALTGNYTQDTTLTSELDANGTGFIEGNITREQWAISPSWTYFLSDKQFFQASFSHYDVNYEESVGSQFFDYTTDTLSLIFSQQWTDSLRNFISVSAMSFLVPELRRETMEYSVNIGMDYQIAATWSTSLTVGRRFTNTEIVSNQLVIINGAPALQEVTISDDVQGMIYSFSLDKQLETGHAVASYSRSTSSQGNGQQRLVDMFNINYRHEASDYLQFFLLGGINFTSTEGNLSGVDDRTYYNVKPSVRWLFNRRASVSLGYQYRIQEFESRSDSAESHSVFLNFNYRWDKLSTQRY